MHSDVWEKIEFPLISRYIRLQYIVFAGGDYMVRLNSMSESYRNRLLSLNCPSFETSPWVTGPKLAERRVALVSTAGLHRRGDRPFTTGAMDYRIIPGDISANDLIMSHVSANFDRTGFQQDWNVVFPLDRGWSPGLPRRFWENRSFDERLRSDGEFFQRGNVADAQLV